MSPEITPGVSRTITLKVGATVFHVRRPSRADEAAIWERYSQKVARSGLSLTADFVASLDGANLIAEARFEVLLRPRRGPRGDEINLGEAAPEHWLQELTDGDGKVIGKIVSFANVDVEEFNDAAKLLAEALKKKAPTPTLNSSASAPDSAKG